MLLVNILMLNILNFIIKQQTQTTTDSSQNIRVATPPKTNHALVVVDRRTALSNCTVGLCFL